MYAGLSRTATTNASAASSVPWAGSMFSIFFREGEVRDYDDAVGAVLAALPHAARAAARAEA